MMKAYNQVRVTEVFEQRKFTGSISLYIHRWSSRFWTIGNNWVSSYYSIVWSISWTSIGYYRSSKVLLADSNNHHQFFFSHFGYWFILAVPSLQQLRSRRCLIPWIQSDIRIQILLIDSCYHSSFTVPRMTYKREQYSIWIQLSKVSSIVIVIPITRYRKRQ